MFNAGIIGAQIVSQYTIIEHQVLDVTDRADVKRYGARAGNMHLGNGSQARVGHTLVWRPMTRKTTSGFCTVRFSPVPSKDLAVSYLFVSRPRPIFQSLCVAASMFCCHPWQSCHVFLGALTPYSVSFFNIGAGYHPVLSFLRQHFNSLHFIYP